jgi:ribonuclease HII
MALALKICGVDEAGRGPLAGPVFAAAVVLDERRRIRGIKDSKLLPEPERDRLAVLIRENAIAFAIAQASVEEIDRLNILRAALLAMRRAVEGLGMVPDEALIDGDHCPALACPSRALVRGDRRRIVIAAASILAKTARDAEMVRLHDRYPQYGLAEHKGYATPEHLARLERYGPSEIHRRSFELVRRLLNPELPFQA